MFNSSGPLLRTAAIIYTICDELSSGMKTREAILSPFCFFAAATASLQNVSWEFTVSLPLLSTCS